MADRKPLLLRALDDLYAAGVRSTADGRQASTRVPWLSGPEDSWL
jgi:hypothetical protein